MGDSGQENVMEVSLPEIEIVMLLDRHLPVLRERNDERVKLKAKLMTHLLSAALNL